MDEHFDEREDYQSRKHCRNKDGELVDKLFAVEIDNNDKSNQSYRSEVEYLVKLESEILNDGMPAEKTIYSKI